MGERPRVLGGEAAGALLSRAMDIGAVGGEKAEAARSLASRCALPAGADRAGPVAAEALGGRHGHARQSDERDVRNPTSQSLQR